MPWSEWQDGPTRIESFQRYAAASLFYGGSLPPGWETYPADGEQPTTEALDVDSDLYGYGTVENTIIGLFFAVGDGWKTARDWFPVALDSLEEGVDYGIRPGRTDSDDDAYIEYESSTDNTVVEEFKPILRYEGGGVGGGPFGTTDGDGIWSMGYVANPTLPDPHSGYREYTVEQWPGLGSVFATDGVVPVGTSYSSAFPDVAGLSTLLVSPKMTGSPPLFGSSEAASFTIGSPSFRYQMPRWRYWIPRELPLRQKQRKDGLALRGAPAWRNQQSRQATNAWRSHL